MMKRATLDIEKVKKELRVFAQERDWEQYHTPQEI
jgi:hypothetical protein